MRAIGPVLLSLFHDLAAHFQQTFRLFSCRRASEMIIESRGLCPSRITFSLGVSAIDFERPGRGNRCHP